MAVHAAAAAAAFIFKSGCLLYSGPINHEPVITIIAPDEIRRGHLAVFTAALDDPDQDARSLLLDWAVVTGQCPTGHSEEFASGCFPGSGCLTASSDDLEVTPEIIELGSFCVWARVTDRQGATAMKTYPGRPLNAFPKAAIEIVGPPLSGPSHYQLFSTIHVSAAKSSDPDGDALEYQFALERPLSSGAALVNCADSVESVEPSSSAERCFVADTAGTYRVSVTVMDPSFAMANESTMLVVAGDALPCITVTEPQFSVRPDDVLVRDPTQPHKFEVKVVTDDGDSFGFGQPSSTLLFAWFHGLADRTPSRLAATDGYYFIPANSYQSGSRVIVGVEVRDRQMQAPGYELRGCDENGEFCEAVAGSSCYQRVSWKVDFL